ncbi:MAG TPA: NAD(P)H-binding protein [Gemmatimonadaceae bacterium]|nr:NAD(P)H-binding protein [Gemmatimonadaceae bacterium]
MAIPSYKAVVVGATGAVGSALVRELLASPRCIRVTALVRRATTMFAHAPGWEKLRLEVVDLADLERATATLAAGCDVAFCTMGIGQPRKVPPEEFRRVDVDYAGAFARGARAAGVRHITLLSSVGADAASRNRYLRVKGDAEAAVAAAGIARTSLFRPSLLVTRQLRYGFQDWLSQTFVPLVAPLLPARYHQIRVEDLARAMRLNAERDGAGGREVLTYPDFPGVV